MNHIYNIIFNHALGLYQVVSEHTRGKCRGQKRLVTNAAASFTARFKVRPLALALLAACLVNPSAYGQSLPVFNTDVPTDVITAAAELKTAIDNYATIPNAITKIALDAKQTAFDTAFNAATIDHETINADTVYDGNNTASKRLEVGANKAGHITVDSGQSLSWQNSHNIKTNQDSLGGALFIDSGAVVVLGAATSDPKETAYLFKDNKASSSSYYYSSSAYGGAIYNRGSLVLSNATFSGNSAYSYSYSYYSSSAYGGAIYNRGSLVLSNATFSGNSVSSSSSAGASFVDAYGGAIYNQGSLVLSNATFSGNSASSSSSSSSAYAVVANGGAIYNYGSLVLSNATFSGNSASSSSSSSSSSSAYGGAIYNRGSLVLSNASFSGNSASAAAAARGGAIYNMSSSTLVLSDVTFSGNSVSSSFYASGGAIFNDYAATLVLSNATFSGNSAYSSSSSFAPHGGAINNNGTIALNVDANKTSLFTGNITNNMGGIDASSISMDGSSTLNINIAGGGLLDMRDPMNGYANTSTAPRTITQQGTGVWKLGGKNAFVNDTTFIVKEGTLYLYRTGEVGNGNSDKPDALVAAGSIYLQGKDSNFTLASGATLAAGGGNMISTGGNITLEGGSTLGFDVAHATNDGGTAGTNAILGLTAGSFTIGTGITIDLLNLNATSGSYTLVTANKDGNIFSGINTAPTLRGEVLNNTRADGLLTIGTATDANKNSLITLTQQPVTNALMNWNKSSDNWNITANNWKQLDGTQSLTQFLHGDIVNFDGSKGGNITINTGGVGAAAIYVSGTEDYTFSGGSLTTDKTNSTLNGQPAASGKLVLGAVATGVDTIGTTQVFKGVLDLTGIKITGANNFTQGIDIYSGTLKVANADQLGTSLNKLDFLSTGSTNIGTLQISGNVVLEGGDNYMERLVIKAGKSAKITVDKDASLTWQNSHNDQTNQANQNSEGGALFIDTGAVVVLGALAGNPAETAYLFKDNKASAATSAYAYGGAIFNKGDLTFGNATFSGNSAIASSDASGGAIYNKGDLTLSNSTFSGNSILVETTGSQNTFAHGGAIFNAANSTLTLNNASFMGNSASAKGTNSNASGGAIYNRHGTIALNVDAGNTSLFTGNITDNNGTIAANSIYMLYNATLGVTIGKDGLLDMRDPMRGDAAQNYPINITQQGAGTWKLGGNNLFTEGGNKTTFAVNEGTLYLYRADEAANGNSANSSAMVEAGKIQLDGANSSFTLGSANMNTTLIASGGNAITTGGTIVLNTGGSHNTTLSFGLTGAIAEATPTSTNAVLHLNAGQSLSITGSGKLNIDLQNTAGTNGEYTLLYNGSTVGNYFSAANVHSNLTLRGQSVGSNSRLDELRLYINDKSLVLNQTNITNALATWTNKANDGVWDIISNNWSLANKNGATLRETQYISGDIINFDGSKCGNITINTGGVGAAAIYLSGTEDYAFSGGSLTTDKTNSTLNGQSAASGKLVLGAQANANGSIDNTQAFTKTLDLTGLAGANNFIQGIDIYSGALKVANANQLGTSLSKLNFLSGISTDVSTAAGNLKTAINTYAQTPNAANKTELDNSQTAFDTAFASGSTNGEIGTLNISDTMTIDGLGGDTERLAIQGNKSAHITLDSGKSLSWQNSHNDQIISEGGALFIDTGAVVVLSALAGNPAKTAYLFTDNKASFAIFANGGAIYNQGSLLLSNATFSGNSASSDDFANGGAIYNDYGATLVLSNATFSGNSASSSGPSVSYAYGGAIANYGTIVLGNATFSGNSASSDDFAYGGAIYNNSGATLALSNATFSGNSASSSGPSVSYAYGGAIANYGTIVLGNATFSGNSAIADSPYASYAYGGAIYNQGTIALNVDGGMTSLFTGNITDNKGTIAANSIYMEDDSTLAVNVAQGGVLDMRDPMRGHAYSKTQINMTKAGVGLWKLGGNNVFTQNKTGKTTFAVNKGTLYLYRAGEIGNPNSHDTKAMVEAGKIDLKGADSKFTLGSNGADTTLIASGGNAITTGGTIALNTGNGSHNTTLAFGLTGAVAENAPTSTNAVLHLNAGQGLSITGSGELNIDLQNTAGTNGKYTLLYNESTGGDTFTKANVNNDLTLRGQSVASNSRLNNLRLIINDKSLVLNQNHVNALATWTNKTNDGVWDILRGNWHLTNESGTAMPETQFISGDAVLFNDTGNNQAITVHSGGVTPAGLVVNSNHDYTFNGGEIILTGNSSLGTTLATGTLKKEGEGTLTFNNEVTGAGAIYGGTMIIGDSIINHNARFTGNVDVYNGATLGGHGQIAGMVTAQSGATIAPGNSMGTLSVGAIIFQSGSTYQFEGDVDGSGDKIIASNLLGAGTALINSGANLSILAGAGTWNGNTTYSILEADNGIQGQFDHIQTNLAFLTPSLNYSDPNKIGLTLNRNAVGFNQVGQTFNQRNTGLGIQSLSAGHPVYNQIVSMNSEQAQNAFDNLSGEIHASLKSAALNNSRYTRNAINQHLIQNAGEAPETERNLWVNTWYHDGHLKGDGNAQKLDNKGFGIMMGVDALSYGATTLGVALGYEQTEVKLGNGRSSSADMDSMHLLAYGRTKAGPIDIRGAIGYSFLSTESKRNIGVGSLIGTNRADYDGSLIQAYIEGSHTFKATKAIDITPYINLAYQRVKTDSFTESAGLYSLGSQLKHKGTSDSQVSTTLGVRGLWRINNISDLYADIGWRHNFGSQTPESTFNFIGGQPYRIKGVKTNRNAAVLGLGANFQLTPKMQLSFGYEGHLGDQSRDHSAKLQWRLNF